MNFALTEELQSIRKVARDFAQKEILPTVNEDDKAQRFRRDIVEKMAALGFLGTCIPEEYGGNNMGFWAGTIIAEEIARVHSSMRLPFNMNMYGPALTLLKKGSEELKQKYIPPLVSAKYMGCFAITEPNAGSDVASMTTRAIRKGNYYVLNGCKTWISNAPVADCGLVYAYTDPGKKVKGMSCFIVDLKTEGVTVKSITEKLGTWAAPVGEIYFDNCYVPASNLVGQEGEGFYICMEQLDDTRLGCMAGGLGLAQACLDASISYATQREQFGQQIGRFQMIQDLIAQMVVEIEACRFLVYRVAWMKDQGLKCTRETSIAKYYTGETVNRCADYAMKIYSAYGYSEEYPVARFYRDAKSYQIVEGTSMIHKLIIANDALGYRKAGR